MDEGVQPATGGVRAKPSDQANKHGTKRELNKKENE